MECDKIIDNTIKSMPRRMGFGACQGKEPVMEKKLVSFKGMGDGVRINIDAYAEMYDIIGALEARIKQNQAFFGDGDCRIQFAGRKFTSGEIQRITDIMKRLLPSARVSFDDGSDKKTASSNDWILEYKEKRAGAAEEHPAEKVIKHEHALNNEEIKEEFYSLFRSNRARLYQGFVHEGMTMRSDGHLILLGTAEKGSELIAVGNILVIGGLYGTAHAGCNGHNGSYILAMDMKPERLKIAHRWEDYAYDEEEQEPPSEPEEEKAKRGLFDRLRKNREPIESTAEITEKSEFSAVALLKNNKIELDNFTIQTFTNPKNMV